MPTKPVSASPRKTAFENGLQTSIEALSEAIRGLYLCDDIPWVIGYSGGKDSTATLQVVWHAIAALPSEQRQKPIHVISTDTLVENPIVAMWVENSLRKVRTASEDQGMPIQAHRLTPDPSDSFWVNLIGRGYPAPRPKFRWCTSRLKINPSNRFINEVVESNGEAILVLGTRKAESAARAANMAKYEKGSTREMLSRHGDLDRSWVFTPIGEWTNDDVWQYLMQVKNPWGYRNKDLLGIYQGATEDGECPLVVDTSTPSCGDSRFGCYVCTLVEQDKSMEAMIQNDHEKEWMTPLMEFRNKYLDTKEDRQHRDFRKMNGSLMVHNGRLVHGPYKQYYRETLLQALLHSQQEVREAAYRGEAPEMVKDFQSISLEELEEIRRIWVVEKHEIEDRLPALYEEATGETYPGKTLGDGSAFSTEALALLKDVCTEYEDPEGLRFELLRELLHIEERHRTMARRSGLFKALDKAMERGAFTTEAEAEAFALRRKEALDSAREQLAESHPDYFSELINEIP